MKGICAIVLLILLHQVCCSSKLESITRTLSNGYKIPIVGFGTNFRTPTEREKAITNAIETGYRHFDTAFAYKNERNLGKVLKKYFDKGVKREEFFITTKLPPWGMRADAVEQFVNMSLSNLGLDYVDMYLIHVPFGIRMSEDFGPLYSEDGSLSFDYSSDMISVWKSMEKQVKAGRVRSIGLSNFNKSQILRIWSSAEIKPTNLQVEGNLYIQQRELLELCDELNIVPTAYSPLGSSDVGHVRRRKRDARDGPVSPLRHPVVERIAEKHDRSASQVLLRYSLQRGFAVIPKSSKPARMRENLDLFGFALDEEDLAKLEALDRNGRVRKFDFFSLLPGCDKHPEYPFRA